MKAPLVFALLLALCWSADEGEFRKDLEFVERVERRLGEMSRKAEMGGFSRELAQELNSYGYPLHRLKLKYAGEQGREEFLRRVDRLYGEVLYIKRTMFPDVLRREMEELGVPFCDVRVEGKRREKLVLVVEDTADEEIILRIVTQTQLGYAHLLGIESVSFEECR